MDQLQNANTKVAICEFLVNDPTLSIYLVKFLSNRPIVLYILLPKELFDWMNKHRETLSVTQAASLCGVGRTTVGYWIRSKNCVPAGPEKSIRFQYGICCIF
jgi:hypothetical protein